MWERLKTLAARLKKLLYAAVIVLLLCVLFYTYLKPEEIPAGSVEFNQIGTLQVRGAGSEESGQ